MGTINVWFWLSLNVYIYYLNVKSVVYGQYYKSLWFIDLELIVISTSNLMQIVEPAPINLSQKMQISCKQNIDP